MDVGRRNAKHASASRTTDKILQIGTEILVRGYQSKDPDCIPKCRGSGRDITFPDGRSIFMGSSGVGAPPGGFPEDDDQ